MKATRDQLGPEQFKVLGQLVPNMFEPGGTLICQYGPRGGLAKAIIEPIGRSVSPTVLRGLKRDGLIDGDLRPTTAGTNLYLRSLVERDP